MLDRKFVLDNPDLIRQTLKARGVEMDFDAFLRLEAERRESDTQMQEANRDAKALAADRSLSDDEKREKGRAARATKDELRSKQAALAEKTDALLLQIPNLAHPESPVGADERANREHARSRKSPRTASFKLKDHVALGEALGIFDFDNASRVAGPGFYYLKGDAVRLERAMESYALDIITQRGFEPHIPPELVKSAIAEGAGYTPRGNESNAYALEGQDLCLIATSEIPLCGLYAEQILDAGALPVRMGGVSHCFRSERAAGRTSRGLFRVHQFNKIEMVVLCAPEDGEKLHKEILTIEREIFDGLGLAYRIVDIATGDLGAPAYRKYDIEAWMPSRVEGGAYAEVSSASHCTDYQARRLNIRYRAGKDEKPAFVHTLNGTALAVGRAMIALLENGQRADGGVDLPPALHAYFGAESIAPPST